MARKTREEAEQTKLLLLDAAEYLFSEQGVANTTLADIANAAGLTRGAVYWHFANKLDLYRAMLDRVTSFFEDLRETLLRTAPAHPARALWNHGQQFFDALGKDAQAKRILLILFMRSENVGELAPIHTECMSHMQTSRDQLASVIQLAINAGQTHPNVEAFSAAACLQATKHGLLCQHLAAQTWPDSPYLLLHYFYQGIFLPQVMAELSPST